METEKNLNLITISDIESVEKIPPINNVEKFISDILIEEFGEKAQEIYNKSFLLQYLNKKSNAIHGNSKTRRSLAAWYSIYTILKFYMDKGFFEKKDLYMKFEGFSYSDLFALQRNLYGGEKLQNHGFNSRTNDEFASKISHDDSKPLIVKANGKYLINPIYIYIDNIDTSEVVVKISERYIELLQNKDNELLNILEKLQNESSNLHKKEIIEQLLTEDSEARIFEIVSYAILSNHYADKKVYIGFSQAEIEEKYLKLYKTGRTNANDGGIDFVMRPLGRFFQVTEVNNYDKYFLDIDKVMKFPITFVVKTIKTKQQILKELYDYLREKFGGLSVIEDSYKESIEEIITINELSEWLENIPLYKIDSIIENIDTYYRLELNIQS